jgi:hypothetical protein
MDSSEGSISLSKTKPQALRPIPQVESTFPHFPRRGFPYVRCFVIGWGYDESNTTRVCWLLPMWGVKTAIRDIPGCKDGWNGTTFPASGWVVEGSIEWTEDQALKDKHKRLIISKKRKSVVRICFYVRRTDYACCAGYYGVSEDGIVVAVDYPALVDASELPDLFFRIQYLNIISWAISEKNKISLSSASF